MQGLLVSIWRAYFPLLRPTCGGLVGNVAVLVDGLWRLILGLSNHWSHGRRVHIGEDAASHSLGWDEMLGVSNITSPEPETDP